MDILKAKKFFKENETCTLMSLRTMTHFIDKDKIYVFAEKEIAESFIASKQNIKVTEMRKNDVVEMTRFCNASGIRKIILNVKGEDHVIPVCSDPSDHSYKNGACTHILLTLKQNKRTEDLLHLTKVHYLVPIEIRYDNGFDEIKYLLARKPHSDEIMGVVFSDIAAFEIWQSEEDPDRRYAPIEIGYRQLAAISQNNGFIINPGSMSFAVTPKMIRQIGMIRKK